MLFASEQRIGSIAALLTRHSTFGDCVSAELKKAVRVQTENRPRLKIGPDPETAFALSLPPFGWRSVVILLVFSLAIAAPLVIGKTARVRIPPLAIDDESSTLAAAPVNVNVLNNDIDPLGRINRSTVSVVTPPRHGLATPSPETGIVTYSPFPDFAGSDFFVYRVRNDREVPSNPALVKIHVKSPGQ